MSFTFAERWGSRERGAWGASKVKVKVKVKAKVNWQRKTSAELWNGLVVGGSHSRWYIASTLNAPLWPPSSCCSGRSPQGPARGPRTHGLLSNWIEINAIAYRAEIVRVTNWGACPSSGSIRNAVGNQKGGGGGLSQMSNCAQLLRNLNKTKKLLWLIAMSENWKDFSHWREIYKIL